MSAQNLEVVGSDIELTFPVVTESGFPYGLMCMGCGQAIDIGQPYASKPGSMTSDGEPINDLLCVYC